MSTYYATYLTITIPEPPARLGPPPPPVLAVPTPNPEMVTSAI